MRALGTGRTNFQRMNHLSITVERLRLRLQICLAPVLICFNFGLIVYFIETQVQQPKIIETCVQCSKLIKKILKLPCDTVIIGQIKIKCMTYQFMKVLNNVKY